MLPEASPREGGAAPVTCLFPVQSLVLSFPQSELGIGIDPIPQLLSFLWLPHGTPRVSGDPLPHWKNTPSCRVKVFISLIKF